MAPSYAVAAEAPSPELDSCALPATRQSASASQEPLFSGLRNVSAWSQKKGGVKPCTVPSALLTLMTEDVQAFQEYALKIVVE